MDTCKECFCHLKKVNSTTVTCGEENQLNLIHESVQGHHPCNRQCTESVTPMHCVYDLQLTQLESGQSQGVELDGRRRTILAYNEQIPGPAIVICEGDVLTVHLENKLQNENTSLHGLKNYLDPFNDGVPWVTQYPILPNDSRDYRFDEAAYTFYKGAPLGAYTQAGTYWYHSQTGNQRTQGAYGALIVKPKNAIVDDIIDDARNTLILQEWYTDSTNSEISCLLINGKCSLATTSTTSSLTTSTTSSLNLEVSSDNPYVFRIIGAMSENIPLRFSLESHSFTVVAADGQDLLPVENVHYLWLAPGERFDIRVNTGGFGSQRPLKMTVFGFKDIANKIGPLCTSAVLHLNDSLASVTNCDPQEEVTLPSGARVLNPPPYSQTEWDTRLTYDTYSDSHMAGNIFIGDLRAKHTRPDLFLLSSKPINSIDNNTQYVELEDFSLNGYRMKFPDKPMLLQQPEEYAGKRCGKKCSPTVTPNVYIDNIEANGPYLKVNCSDIIPENCGPRSTCQCQHVIDQPWAPFYWMDIVLINKHRNATAYPLHLHGGPFWVMRMEKFDHDINATFIERDNTNCDTGDQCLWIDHQSYNSSNENNNPPAKDTIQIPPGGYAYLRIPLDNRGMWLLESQINHQMTQGMSLVLQVGGYEQNDTLAQRWGRRESKQGW